MSAAELRVLGVRHHGPGSARALLAALDEFAPDCVLVEGPPDADDLIPWLDHPALELPVALLVYCPDEPRRATFYPFAVFSPEYQALRYALEREAEVGFMDLPRRHMLAAAVAPAMPPSEPFRLLAQAAGHDGYEQWWNDAIEQRRTPGDIFAAVLDMAASLREAGGEQPDSPGQALADAREAAMRRRIRQAAAEGRHRIAAVCGAWHAPALVDALAGDTLEDESLLRDLPAIDVAAAWVPWTYGRLTQAGGYGAGVGSPGWYDHLWEQGRKSGAATWLTRVARLLREEGFDVSAAHVIEAVRLAEALAALRGRPFPALPELDEATQAVLCYGDAEPMQLIRRRLIVGERMGLVPPDAPAVPLQRDLRVQQTRLRLRPEPEPSTLKLDLRQETHLERSRLLHRLGLLDIAWGVPVQVKGQPAGTFGELWQLRWQPDLSLRVIEAAMWGNTVRDAAAALAEDTAQRETELPALTALIDRAVLADLPEAIPAILERIEALAAEGDASQTHVAHLLEALPPLAHVLRYGGLRRTAELLPLLRRVFEHLLIRACLALPRAAGAGDAGAAELAAHLSAVTPAVGLVESDEAAERWFATLDGLADRRGIQATVAGRATRLLHEAGERKTLAPTLSQGERGLVGVRLARALSGGTVEEARYAADWLEGFLRDSGLLLLHDPRLWAEVDGWLGGLTAERFVEVLPLLRRTFADYPEGVRQQLQRRTVATTHGTETRAATFDPARAASVLPVVRRLLGLDVATEVGQ